MSKFLLVSLLLGLSSQAHADYRDSYNLQRMCQADGNLAGEAFENKQDGKSLSDAVAEMRGYQPAIDIVKKVYTGTYTSKKDAYMSLWSKCMDDHPNG